MVSVSSFYNEDRTSVDIIILLKVVAIIMEISVLLHPTKSLENHEIIPFFNPKRAALTGCQ